MAGCMECVRAEMGEGNREEVIVCHLYVLELVGWAGVTYANVRRSNFALRPVGHATLPSGDNQLHNLYT